MIMNEKEYFTVAEAARLLDVSTPTVWRWVNSGWLPAYRIGAKAIRIRRTDLQRVVAPARVKGPGSGESMERKAIQVGDHAVDTEELLHRLEALQQRILARRPRKRLRPSEDVIREAREERAGRL